MADPGPAEPSTLYPKITAHIDDLQDAILALPNPPPSPYPFTGTVKLHGTHADILLSYSDEDESHSNPTITFQSRNRPNLTLESDNMGFAKFCSTRLPTILSLGTQILRHHSTLTPSPPGRVRELLIAGEWIGPTIQKSVALALLPDRCFVICSLRLDGLWLPIPLYPHILAREARIHNICEGGLFHLSFDPGAKGARGKFELEAKTLTEEVANRCPFAEKVFGVEGEGEGIVWTPSAGSGLPNAPELWLKTKGEKFAVRGPRVAGVKGDERARARGFAEEVCAEARLEQGMGYLEEMGIGRTERNVWGFVSWVVGDVEVEERRGIAELGIERTWRREVGRVAGGWYRRRIGRG